MSTACKHCVLNLDLTTSQARDPDEGFEERNAEASDIRSSTEEGEDTRATTEYAVDVKSQDVVHEHKTLILLGSFPHRNYITGFIPT